MRLLLLAISLVDVHAISAQPAKSLPATTVAKIEAAVKAEIERQGLIAVAVGVVNDGDVAFTKAFGLADHQTTRPASTTTVFNWASNSKPLAAVLAMQLVELGKLDLDADIRKYIPEFPDKSKTITVRQLLCHQSGIPHYSNGKVIANPTWPFRDEPLNPLAGVGRFADSPLIFDPGEKTAYSSYAYVVLSAVIQRAGSQPFEEQVRERIVKPLHLSSFEWDVDSAGHPTWATGYVRNSSTKKVSPAKEEAHAWKQGAGGFKSNIDDFAKWAAALTSNKLLKEGTKKMMWTPQKTNDGKSTAYGLGFAVSRRGEPTVSHGGSQAETKTQMIVQPNLRRGVVVMSNCSFADPTAIAKAVQSAVWDEAKNAKE